MTARRIKTSNSSNSLRSSKSVRISLMEHGISENYIKYFKFENFINVQEIGAGTFSQAYRANRRHFSGFVALKSFFNLSKTTIEEIIKEFKLRREFEYYEHIIHFYGITKPEPVSDSDKYLLILEYADGGSLQSYLKNNFQSLGWDNKFDLAYQLVSSVLWLHSKGITHRDLHSKNIFVHQNILKLGDFGLIKRIDERSNVSSRVYGVIPYIDPKVLVNRNNRGERYELGEESDVYSVGVLLWEISSGQPPFYTENGSYDFNLAFNITKGLREEVIVDTPNEYVKLYTKCWNGEPEKRPTMRQVVTKLKEITPQTNLNTEETENLTTKLSKLSNESNESNESVINGDHLLILDDLSELVDKIVDFFIKIINEGKTHDQRIIPIEDFIVNENDTTLKKVFIWVSNNQDYSNCIFLLGYFNLSEIETKKNNVKAFNLFLKASKKGNILAKYYVGECYQYGYGIEKDERSAFECYQDVSSKNFAAGQSAIGYFYQNGIGVEQNERMAICFYKKAAYNENLIAIYNLGICFFYGKGVAKDDEMAFNYLKLSADKGYLHGIAMLAYCHSRGVGTSVDKKKSFELFQKASDLGDNLAQYNLAEMYENGDGVTKDMHKAIHWYKICADNGFQAAKDKLRLSSESNNNNPNLNRISDEIVNLFIRSALDNDENLETRRQGILGYLSRYGLTLENFIDWLIHNQNILSNVFLLGYLNYVGIGTRKNNDQAFRLLKIAAGQGHVLAQYFVGLCYQFGHGTVKSDKLAFEYFQKVADQDFPAGQVKIGYFYENGIGIEKNENFAVYWYKKSASKGNIIATYNLGYCYLYGKGIEKNDIKAFGFFKQSAEKDYSFGITMLGYFYQNGIATNVDKNKAFEFYQKAAKLESNVAQYNLADMYFGEMKDIDKAMFWFEKAAKNGCEEAQKRFEELLEFRR